MLPVLHVHDLDTAGSTLELTLPAAWLAEVFADTEAKAQENTPATARLHALRDGVNVILTGTFRVPVTAPCVRCLEPAPLVLDGSFTLHLEPAVRATSPIGERELSADELDVDTFDGERVVVADWLREQILLELPQHPRHAQECPLPAAVGESAAQPLDPRLAPLARLRLSNPIKE